MTLVEMTKTHKLSIELLQKYKKINCHQFNYCFAKVLTTVILLSANIKVVTNTVGIPQLETPSPYVNPSLWFALVESRQVKTS